MNLSNFRQVESVTGTTSVCNVSQVGKLKLQGSRDQCTRETEIQVLRKTNQKNTMTTTEGFIGLNSV